LFNCACSELIEHILRDNYGTDRAAAFLESKCTAPGVIGNMDVSAWVRVLREANGDWGRTVCGARLVQRVVYNPRPNLPLDDGRHGDQS